MAAAAWRAEVLLAVGLGCALAAGCSAGTPASKFLDGAASVPPVKYDTEAERGTAGRAACLPHQDGKSDQEIAESIVMWVSFPPSSGASPMEEAARFVPYALRHCDCLLSADAAAFDPRQAGLTAGLGANRGANAELTAGVAKGWS